MRVMVVGASGYLGSNLVRHFVQAGFSVIGSVRSEADAQIVRSKGAEALKCDLLLDLDPLLDALADVDAIVFAPQLLLNDEYECITAIFERIKGKSKTFIYTSGSGVLSQRTDGAWSEDTFAEEDTFKPSKYIGERTNTEQLVLKADEREIRGMVVRPPLIWGHGGAPIIRQMFEAVAITGKACYVGAGLNLYSNVHVDDLATVYERALLRGSAGSLYHAVAGETNYRTIAHAIAGQLGVGAQSVTLSEAMEIWDKFSALILFSTCSRTRSPLTRLQLDWQPHPERLDLLTEISHPTMMEWYQSLAKG